MNQKSAPPSGYRADLILNLKYKATCYQASSIKNDEVLPGVIVTDLDEEIPEIPPGQKATLVKDYGEVVALVYVGRVGEQEKNHHWRIST